MDGRRHNGANTTMTVEPARAEGTVHGWGRRTPSSGLSGRRGRAHWPTRTDSGHSDTIDSRDFVLESGQTSIVHGPRPTPPHRRTRQRCRLPGHRAWGMTPRHPCRRAPPAMTRQFPARHRGADAARGRAVGQALRPPTTRPKRGTVGNPQPWAPTGTPTWRGLGAAAAARPVARVVAARAVPCPADAQAAQRGTPPQTAWCTTRGSV